MKLTNDISRIVHILERGPEGPVGMINLNEGAVAGNPRISLNMSSRVGTISLGAVDPGCCTRPGV